MSKRSWMRFVATPVLMAGLAAPALMAGCSDPAAICGAELGARIVALNEAVEALIAVSSQMRKDVTVACVNIATDLGEMGVPAVNNSTDPADITDEDLNTACTLANNAVSAALQAGVTINIGIEGGYCTVNAEAQLSCEAECSVDAKCDPGTIDVRCDPGELSVVCEGSCKAGATCQGTASVKATCTGSCSGKCEGTCGGQPTAAGGEVCNSTCEGDCSGDCVLDANVDVQCGAEVHCKGGCDTTYTAPRCEGELTPPSCDVDADCNAGCQGSAKFEAECVAPQIVVEFEAGDNQALADTLTTNLPLLVSVAFDQGPLVVSAAADVVEKFAGAADAVGSTVACSIYATANLAANATLSVEASASVSASASASVNVSGSAGAEG